MNKKEIKAGLPQTPGYRYARLRGSQLHVAGQVPNDSTGSIVGDDTFTQAKQCLLNLVTILNCYQFSRNDIQHLTIHVVGGQEDLADAWQAVCDEFAGEVPPATLLGVTRLGYEKQLVEIEAVVIKESA